MVVIIPIQRNRKKRTTTHEMWRKRARKNDGWQQQTLRNGTTKGRRGKLVASCRRLWNSSAHSCEFCEQQQCAAYSGGGDRSPCQMELLLPVTNRCSRRHLTPPHTAIPSVNPGPLARSRSSPLRRVHLPTDRPDGRSCWEQPNGHLGSAVSARPPARPAVVNCFNREKETHAASCRRHFAAEPTHTD